MRRAFGNVILIYIFKVFELQKKWKSFRDSFRRKYITKSGQASKKSTPYIYANILGFLTPTMQNRMTESNVGQSVDEASDEQEGETEDVGLIVGKNISVEEIMDDIDVENQQPKKKNPDDDSSIKFWILVVENIRKQETDTRRPGKIFFTVLTPSNQVVNRRPKINGVY
ncbi:uncharacterized protein LOC132930050 [Rhopalosiphum padi]|uniref:uncharacterized protein LOC132930050 n=1 Tax=Rhopalosiphum padi TaxID=40932 RepID=UPI00298D7589|nr:uncharacterized protein LOC132930050 [Rhopalosiphum padi]